MRLVQKARLAVLSAAVFSAAACSDSSNEPSEFNPEGAGADLAAAEAAFTAPTVISYGVLSSAMIEATGGNAAITRSAEFVTAGPSEAERYAQTLLATMPSGSTGLRASVRAIPPEALGVTYVLNSAGDYVPSERAGAPEDGVRFILYAVNPVTGEVDESLTEIGYVDIIEDSGNSTVSYQVLVVSNEITYLDYTATASSSGTATIEGYVTDGNTRANFHLDNVITSSNGSLGLRLDYDLDVPSRDVELDYLVSLTGLGTGNPSTELDLTMRGPNGVVNITGDVTDNEGGTLDVLVNGDLFATLTYTTTTLTVTGADGEPLSEVEQDVLADLFQYYEASLEVFTALILPVTG